MNPLRPGLLDRHEVVLAGSAAPAVSAVLCSLGAHVQRLEPSLDDDGAEAWARERPGLGTLVYDARGEFASGGPDALRRALDGAWRAVRAVGVGALIASEDPAKIILVAPADGAGRHAVAARAALENLARTLSVEWARYGVSVTALLPGTPADVPDADLATVIAFLVSRAGAYCSGCAVSLPGGPAEREHALIRVS